MMRLSRGQNFLALFASGALLPLALAPASIWPIAIVSIAVLFWALENQTLKQAFIKASIFGFGLFFAGVSWVYVSIHDHGYIAAPLALLGTSLFCLFIALIFAAPFALSALIPQSPWAMTLGLPALWVLSEWLRGWLLTGFPWLYAGYSHTDTWLNGWAPLGGVLLLSYFTALAAAVVSQVLFRGQRGPTVVTAGSLVAVIALAGYGLQKIDWTQATGTELSVVLIQPNVEQEDRWSLAEQDGILDRLVAQTEPYWGADLIIWPEGAIPALPRQVMDYLLEVDARAKVNQTALLTGIPTQDARNRRYYNSMLALGDSRGQYDKTRLVPFGEYVPLEGLLRGVNRFFDLPMSSFSLGAADQPLLTAKGQQIATAICYEIAYPNLVAKTAATASIILTVSNDAWFGRSMAPQQHMQMARMRAIENAKPLVRGTNNGVTAMVNYRGEVEQQLDQFSTAELSGTVKPRTGQTVFTQLGSWPIVIFAALICGGLVICRRRNKN
ncbi:MAG: apolipoprotein N-acyltransferase [Porticoccaceae bacterium]|nr:apolipoprotein N-acyltransferase [Porticoccaceae bacterium]MBT7257952.1 apolipoprotein N-acyltransferase [Porticoccaceae bacterium]